MRNPKSFRFTSWLSEFTFFRLTPHALRLTLALFSLAPLLLYSPSAVYAQWEPDRRLTYSSGGASTGSYNNSHCIAANEDTVYVVWSDYRDGNTEIYFKRSTDGGTTWGVDTRLTEDSANSVNPSIAVSGVSVHVVWQDGRNTIPFPPNDEIYYKLSRDGGVTWGPDTRLSYSEICSFLPCVAVSDSFVYVVWWDHMFGSNFYYVYYKRSKDGGCTWDSDTCFCRNSDVPYPSVAVSGHDIHIIWEDSRRRGNASDICYKRSTDCGATWLSDTLLTDDTLRFCSFLPSIAVLDSNVHITWSSNRDQPSSEIYYKRSTNEGVTWEPDARLTFDTSYSFLSAVSVSGSNVHIVWWSDLDYDSLSNIYYRHSTDGGVTWWSSTWLTHVFKFAYPAPYIAIGGSRVHVVWMDDRDNISCEIYYKRNPTWNSGVEVSSPISLSPCLLVPLSVAPNPFTSFATLPGHSSDRFVLYDISGRWVGTYRGDRVGADLTPGVYFLVPERKKANPLRIVKLR